MKQKMHTARLRVYSLQDVTLSFSYKIFGHVRHTCNKFCITYGLI